MDDITAVDDLAPGVLEDKITLLAGRLTSATGRFLVLLGAFDAQDGWHGVGIVSCAHWLN
jgi:hypothetical protein